MKSACASSLLKSHGEGNWQILGNRFPVFSGTELMNTIFLQVVHGRTGLS